MLSCALTAWSTSHFLPLCKISRGRVISKKYIHEHSGEYPVYSSQTLNDGNLGGIDSYDYDGEYLTWTTDGANAGSVFHRSGCFSITNVCGLLDRLPDSDVILRYLYYWLTYDLKRHVSSGMGNPKLMSNVVANVKVPVPPVELQEEIVRILDSFSALEAELERTLEAELEARKKQYAYYRDQLLTFTTDIRHAPLSDLCEKISSGKCKQKQDVGKYPVYGSTGVIARTDIPAYEGFSLLVARVGANAGYVHTADGKYDVSDNTLMIKLGSSVHQRYMFHVLTAAKLNQYAKGGGQPLITAGQLKAFQIPVPPIEVQERIVEVLDNFDALCSDLGIGLPAELEARRKQYTYYRDCLLDFPEKIRQVNS